MTKSVGISLLTYPKYSQPNKNRFILGLSMQFGKVAADVVLFRFREKNIQFSEVVFEISPLSTVRGHVSVTDFEAKYSKKY